MSHIVEELNMLEHSHAAAVAEINVLFVLSRFAVKQEVNNIPRD